MFSGGRDDEQFSVGPPGGMGFAGITPGSRSSIRMNVPSDVFKLPHRRDSYVIKMILENIGLSRNI